MKKAAARRKTQKEEDESGSNKQRLNLSPWAWGIIENDMFAFGEGGNALSLSGFLNTVFFNFRKRAKASRSLAAKKKQQELEDCSKNIPVKEWLNNNWPIGSMAEFIKKNISNLEKLISEYLSRFITEFTGKYKSYRAKLVKGEGKNFTINKDNYLYLTNQCAEYDAGGRAAYKTRGKYLKALFEEYAAKPYHRRERIFFADNIRKIESAKKKGEELVITTGENRQEFFVKPYKIMTDSLSSFNYLVGLSARAHTKPYEAKPFRITRIQNIETKSGGNGRLSGEEKKAIEDAIKKRGGVQFLYYDDPDKDIHVRLTPRGVKRYYFKMYLRPAFRKKYKDQQGRDVYIFQCTEEQIQRYFFDFGRDAVILEPKGLRNTFEDFYREALAAYQDS